MATAYTTSIRTFHTPTSLSLPLSESCEVATLFWSVKSNGGAVNSLPGLCIAHLTSQDRMRCSLSNLFFRLFFLMYCCNNIGTSQTFPRALSIKSPSHSPSLWNVFFLFCFLRSFGALGATPSSPPFTPFTRPIGNSTTNKDFFWRVIFVVQRWTV